MLEVVLLGVAAAVSPAILAVVIVILRTPSPRRLLAAYLLGGILTSLAVGIAIVSSLNGLDLDSSSSSAPSPVVDFTLGALALLVAFVLVTDRTAGLERRRAERAERKPQRDPWSQRVLSRGTASIAFAVGVVFNLPGGFYLITLKDVAEDWSATGAQLAAIVIFNLVMFLPIELPLIGYSFAPEETSRRVQALNDWMGSNARQIVIWLSLVFGAVMIVRGVVAL